MIRPEMIPASMPPPFQGFPGGLSAAVATGNLPLGFFNAPFNPNFANNHIFQQAAAAASTANAAPKPAIPYGAPQGFPAAPNGLSPLPSSSKISDQNRHKIHELKTEGSPVVASISSSPAMTRSITAGTSGNPMDLLSLRQTPRSNVPPPPVNTAPLVQGAPLNLQQTMMFRHVSHPSNLCQHQSSPF